MSKQSTLTGFISKPQTGNNTGTVTKLKGFKYVKPTERKKPETLNNENANLNCMIQSPKETETKKTATRISCIEISDDEGVPNPIHKSAALSSLRKNDSFVDFSEDDLVFTKPTDETRSALTVEDVYAKYGSPETKPNSTSSNKSDDLFDIEKSLSSNPSYIEATKKLSDNMNKLDSSKPAAKPPANSKFKFNVRSSKATASANATLTTTTTTSISSFIGSKTRIETVTSTDDSHSKKTLSNSLTFNGTYSSQSVSTPANQQPSTSSQTYDNSL